MNLCNVGEEIRLQLEAVKEHAKELSSDAATWWNYAEANIPAKVEETKQNIKQYGYDGIIGSLAKADNVDPLLILSIITVESGGNPNVKNDFGYIGCMQVDPRTYGVPDELSSNTLVNAQYGIEGGIRAIYDKHNAYPNNVYLMIASYNAGQGIVHSAIKQFEDENAVKWWNSIEYIAQAGVEAWGSGKWDEIGKYAISVMYAYTKFAGYEIKIGKLPQAHDPNKKTDLSGFMIGGLSAPANAAPKKGTPFAHGKHKDTPISAPEKLYCEPVYPDYVCISDEIPPSMDDVIEKIPITELKIGENMFYSIPVSSLTKYGGDSFVDAMAMNSVVEQQRKKAFNPDEHRHAYKVPSSGKPANNNDPFPVDAKIEEFETHYPRCKINKIVACEQAVSTAVATMQLSMNVEKRLVKLENNIATILRYLHRLGARVPVNCVYYGGQCTSEKYKCIRCMKDDRLSDGQLMSIDQCLNCTRYEPIIGQVYDILNDEGLNLSQILDDNQMSYTTMEEYCNFVSPTESQEPLITDILDANSAKIRLPNETDFKDEWPQGVKMKWDLFPVEDQKPHINHRQSITQVDYEELSSSAFTVANYGCAFTGSSKPNKLVENQKQIENYLKKNGDSRRKNDMLHEDVLRIIREAKNEVVPKFGQFVDDMKNYLAAAINTLIKGKDTDNILIASIVFATGRKADMVVQDLEKLKKELSSGGVDNLVLSTVFISFETNLLFGKKDNKDETLPARLDKVRHEIPSDGEDGTSSKIDYGLKWEKVNNWDWLDFVEPLNINYFKNEKSTMLDEKMKIFVKIAYIYVELRSKCSTSRYDNIELGLAFPFFEEQLSGIKYTSPFCKNRLHPVYKTPCRHCGIDLGADTGTEIHCIADGTVEWVLADSDPASNGGGNMICVRHSGELTSRYLHMEKLEVKAGQNLKKGEVLGHVGNTGVGTAPHLHFEVQIGGTSSEYSRDPAEFFPMLKNINLYDMLSDLK